MSVENIAAAVTGTVETALARTQRARRTFWQVFGVPIVLGLVSIIGLVAALVGDGLYDAVSWITLSIPVVVILKYLR